MDRRFVPSEQAYFLKVKGDSMIGRGINNGDYVMVNPTAVPEEGAVIAARLGEEATVKSLHHRDGQTVLEPANPAEKTYVVRPGEDFSVLGVVSGVFRPFFDAKAFENATPA